MSDKVYLKVDDKIFDVGTEADLINKMNAEGIEDFETVEEINLGDTVQLIEQTQEVVKCQETGVKMLNIDPDQLFPGDLSLIKRMGLTISNPETDHPVALGVDYNPETFGEKVAKFFEKSEEEDEDDDDSSYFSIPSFGGSSYSSGGGFGGGFGGFGGGSFGGGGASRSF